MKNKRLGVISVLLIIGIFSFSIYAYYGTHDDPLEVVLNWQFNNSEYKNEEMVESTFSYDPSHESCEAYCSFSSGEWLYFGIEKGFLGTWHVENAQEVPFEELPEWVYESMNKEPEILEEWEVKHREELEKMTTYDQYISDGTIYHIKLKNDMWMILKITKDPSEKWSIKEMEIGKDPEEIAENLYTWYSNDEITTVEIGRFLETLARDGVDTTTIREELREDGVPL